MTKLPSFSMASAGSGVCGRRAASVATFFALSPSCFAASRICGTPKRWPGSRKSWASCVGGDVVGGDNVVEARGVSIGPGRQAGRSPSAVLHHKRTANMNRASICRWVKRLLEI
jgi:hypothetical protein